MDLKSFDLIRSPFQRLRALLGDAPPGAPPIDMSIGEPRHGMPDFAADILNGERASFGKYPPVSGIPALRTAIAGWIARRYPSLAGKIDADRHIVPLNGSREGLFSALFIAAAMKGAKSPAVLMPNPFYQAYLAAALATGCEPVFLSATQETDFLPDLDAIEPALLGRTAALYLASPANPQGAVASPAYLAKACALARQHGFMLFVDECYSEIYCGDPPAGALECAASLGDNFAQVLSFNSLSKRSSAPGLRSAFVAGDAAFLAAYLEFRNVASPQIPVPIQHASAALWAEEIHAAQSRDLYRRKFDLAQECLGGLPNFRLPGGGFFLWLDLSRFGGGEAVAETLWQGCGVKILPGAYLAQTDERGINPGQPYARVALVQPLDLTAEAFERIARFLR